MSDHGPSPLFPLAAVLLCPLQLSFILFTLLGVMWTLVVVRAKVSAQLGGWHVHPDISVHGMAQHGMPQHVMDAAANLVT